MLKNVKPIVRGIPVIGPLCKGVARRYRSWKTLGLSVEETFVDKFRRNAWGGTESVSGTGSDSAQTRRIIAELPALLREFKICSILDLPCGDFFWMRQVELRGIRYIGGDIVPELILRNKAFEASTMEFRRMDILTSPLPKLDLVLCRDCLVHFAYEDVFRALNNICRSSSMFLLTTTFPRHDRNRDISTGEWRSLNLELKPFHFPSPLRLLEEGCSDPEEYSDKSLGLWGISDLKKRLAQHGKLQPF